jgi:7-carboxy-7-deazaguanine synthase
MRDTLRINEIYLSLQGESTWAGLPCIFIRLTGCPLRCSYCDTAYAFKEGVSRTYHEVMAEVQRLAAPYGCSASMIKLPLVELTGGEPLAQAAVLPLMTGLCDAGFTVLLETSGAIDISAVDRRVHRIMDIKCPSSGESGRNRLENIQHLRPSDEIKFVIATREDYDWAKEFLAAYKLEKICPVLFSWATPLAPAQQDPSLKPFPEGHRRLGQRELAELIIADRLPVRFQTQLHKILWPPEQRGV